MKHIPLGLIVLTLLTATHSAQAAYPEENYPQDIREQGYPNTLPQPRPVPPMNQAEQAEAKQSKRAPVVVTESRQLLPLLICEKTIAKEDRHLVKSCSVDADKLYLTTQKGIELVSAKNDRGEDLYLGKHNKAHEIKNVLNDNHITVVLTTLKNKRYTMELITK